MLFRPYYQFKEGERYFIYFDPKHPWTRVPLSDLKFSPGWSLNLTEDMQITTNVGAYVEHTFTGTRIRWIGRKFDDAGKCEVSIDGKKPSPRWTNTTRCATPPSATRSATCRPGSTRFG